MGQTNNFIVFADESGDYWLVKINQITQCLCCPAASSDRTNASVALSIPTAIQDTLVAA